ncbi:nuclear transport factor 2 family protein [Streptomyces albiflaviniger]|nr:nuclear transport factor 2 family protein [Streptomyces albiflaviniger]
MSDDSEQIRALIEGWAAAVHRGDLTEVTASHADDIVMFDVPPPYEGVRGLAAYREVWPPFFVWQAQGACFEIEELEVTAGEDVAFAFALLRCGTEEELAERPEVRLRLTLGLRKEEGVWVVAHEHHSFPDLHGPDEQAQAEREVRAVHQHWFDRTAAKDLDGLMAHIAEDIVSYEHDTPLQYLGRDQVREVCRAGLDSAPGEVTWDVPEMEVLIRDDLAVVWGLNHMTSETGDGTTEDTWSRGTRVFQRRGGHWQMIHQHLSFPLPPRPSPAG